MPTTSSETADPLLAEFNLYNTDFYGWIQQQIRFLRDRQLSRLDLPNLIEEMESLGKQQRQELRNRLSLLLGHLLKWHYQPTHRSRSWLATLRIQRIEIADLLEDNPSLKPYLEEAFGKAYQKGIELAVQETDLPHCTFPADCPYRLAELLDHQFYPGQPSDLLTTNDS